ncbi:hypothetical protein K493DRAFT_329473 [Basidiobolus meristosporus CBS 931.73]|uniref:Aminoglycoside phosphotransferase domain-containing protein n=1 Tax=Basidiobolus meristosporus CBS 931.73 TaxID=1314790 RepID=A0A1Y1YHX0_9FUNG|nr:hypothetical protein K493DRAFT_329473 [Basidiobolus meristosporus CBS 931.73]|eukprot:ORX97306.1 hypothetical protein K493DRAFT_329473 [Basidiobolus meristosporus CBS 931.73]
MAEDADYQSYLNSIFPNTTWSISRLAGGIVNFTFRATLTSGSAPYTSLILKHARPYIAFGGPEWEFTTERQDVEAELLSLWGDSGALCPQRNLKAHWRSPQLIRHDQGIESTLGLSPSTQEASVLILADLGELVNIVEFLKFHASEGNKNVTSAQLKKIATTIGQAFGIIHSPSTASIIHSLPKSAARLTHSYTKAVEYQTGVEPIRQRLEPRSDAEHLYKRVLDEFHNVKYNYPECLALGDFSPGSVLMDAPTPNSDLTPIIVDWEFARLNGQGVNADIAGFLASMRCELILLEANGSKAEYDALLSFTDTFCAAYRETSNLSCQKRSDNVHMQLLRSTFIIHGREMLNRAYDTYDSSPCSKDMVDLGSWYIEHACDDVEQFLDDANWENLKQEPGLMIQSLFKIE